MDTDPIGDRLKSILAEELGYPLGPGEILEDTCLYGKGIGLSSVDVMSLIVRIEEAFGVFFEDDEITVSVETLGSLARAVRRKLGAGGRPGGESLDG